MRKLLSLFICMMLVYSIFPIVSFDAASTSFKDVPNNHPNKKEIDYLVNLNVINGYNDGTFKPQNTVTNAQAAIMIARSLKLSVENRQNPNFKDVFSTTSGFKEIAALVEEGIIDKTATFSPNSPISREDMARMLVNAFKLEGTNHVNFSDVGTDYWAYNYITKLAANNITTGYPDGSFKPKNTVTRGNFAAFMARALNTSFRPSPSVVRGVNFKMNIKQVEAVETAKLKKRITDGKYASLVYDADKFGYPTELQYLFVNGQLSYIVFDFLPQKNSYNTWNEMSAIHDMLHKNAIKELGTDYFFNTNKISTLTTMWKKDFYTVILTVDDKELYTKASLTYYNM